MRLTPDTAFRRNNQNSSRASIKLIWREGERAPCGMSDYNNATIDGGKLYILHGNRVYAYTISSSSWSRHSDSPTYNCPLVIIHNLLTLVGGLQCGTITNKLFSLSEEGTWTEKFPPMQTTREGSTALCTGTALVAGGRDKDLSALWAVEVLNTETLQWSIAADLPVVQYHYGKLRQQFVVIVYTY